MLAQILIKTSEGELSISIEKFIVDKTMTDFKKLLKIITKCENCDAILKSISSIFSILLAEYKTSAETLSKQFLTYVDVLNSFENVSYRARNRACESNRTAYCKFVSDCNVIINKINACMKLIDEMMCKNGIV